MNFSVCVITKNEALTLPKLVASLGEFQRKGGEIVVLDTGSTDGTADLARRLGCVVTEVGEQFLHTVDAEMADAINKKFIVDGEEPAVKAGEKYFDFSSARNHAASLASNDWICYADADEAFTKLDVDKLNEIISTPEITNLIYEFVFAHDPQGRPAIQFHQSKFYNRKRMHWEGLVHELLRSTAGNTKEQYVGPEIFFLEHWQNQETGRHTYLRGLAVDCYLNPNNDRNSHYLGREFVWDKRPKSAIKELTRHIAMNGWLAERSESYLFMGDAYSQLNQADKQAECFFKAFHLDSTRRAPFIRLAQFYRFYNNPQAAACYAMAALQIPWSPFYANTVSHYQQDPHDVLYWALGWLGNTEGAKEHLLKCLEYQPHNSIYLGDTKYFFEYPDQKIEGWMTFPELTWLYETAKRQSTIVEVGSWKGRSTHALLTGCKNGVVTAIDTWAGSIDPRDDTNRLAKQENILEVFKKNVGHFPNLKIVQSPGMEAVKNYADNSIDMVFIDAGHTYEEVFEDITAWLPKVKDTGIISGHDYMPQTWMGVCQAVDEILGPINRADSIWWIPKAEIKAATIPKKIHTIWLSDDPIPETIQKIIDTQKISGYQHSLVTMSNFPPVRNAYLDAAIQAKKWVKAADYLRMWLIANEGGIVLDADMEILSGKNFDDMLSDPMFAGVEENGFVGYSLVGGVKGHPVAKEYLKVVPERFKGDDDKNFESSMEIFTHLALGRDDVKIYSPLYFFPYNHQTGIIDVQDYTRTFHHFLKSWINTEDKLPTVSIIIPQLGREGGLKRCLDSIDALYYPKHLLEVIIEKGDETVPVKVANALAKAEGEVIVYAANDIEFTRESLYRAVKLSEKGYGLVAFNTGEIYEDEGNICEHFLITEELIKQLDGQIFDTDFHHVGVDNLLWAKAKKLNQATRCEEAVVIHHHFTKGNVMDEVYDKGWSKNVEDRELLKQKLAVL